MKHKTEQTIKLTLLILIVTLFSTWQYLILNLSECHNCLRDLNSIYRLDFVAPFAYRILTPAIIVWAGNSLMTMIAFQFVMFGLFYLLVWRWCVQWAVSVDVVFPLVAIAISYMMKTYYFALYTITEWKLWLLVLLLMRWSHQRTEIMPQRRITLLLLVIVGTLNREMTGLLMLLSIIAFQPHAVRYWLICGIAWLIVILLLRSLIPVPSDSLYTIANVWRGNANPAAFSYFLMHAGPVILIIVYLYRHVWRVNNHLKLMILTVLVPYLALWFLFAYWSESRLLMPVILLAIPCLAVSGE